MDRITHCVIHPGIGIARVGDSPDEFFIGPERRGADAPATYKDRAGRIKRQAARFRIFGYDAAGALVGEVTAADAQITWSVHLVNRKGAADAFYGPRRPRNADVPGPERASLVIDAGVQQAPAVLAGEFRGERVALGELRLDEAGRLLVLGGHGHAASVPADRPLPSFADNDGWYDDTSDGPVTATVRFPGAAAPIEAGPARVVVAPPDFAPAITNLVTLYDVAEQVAYERGELAAPDKVSFDRDIRPILARAADYQWVSAPAIRGHRSAVDTGRGTLERPGDFFESTHYALLTDPSDGAAAKARKRVFALMRAPRGEVSEEQRKRQARAQLMPQLSGDHGRATPGEPDTWFTVTPLQYLRLKLWAAGQFTVAAGEDPTAGGDAEPGPAELDRVALESCVGGPFFPGIEVSSRCRDKDLYERPFRLRADLPPGHLTEQMAVPWQADFSDCRHFWWPAQRPDDVIAEADYRAVVAALFPGGDTPRRPVATTAFPRWRWDRGVGDQIPTALAAPQRTDRRHREMVKEWSGLGFVRPSDDGTGVHVETERKRYAGLRHRDYFHIMLNPQRYPDFRPVARELAEGFLAAAVAAQQDPYLDTDLRPFDYDEVAFEARMTSIYHDLVDVRQRYDPARDQTFRTRADAIERLRQSAPLNQTDGVWLRNVATVGPIDELTGFLIQIWLDELGGGDPAQNHANIYTRTLNAAGIHPAPIASVEYAQDERLQESAFTLPLFQLVISEFTADYLPEILGMTLYLEWESVELDTTARMLQHHGLDPTYYQLHVAIDNASAGHGAIAKQAVKRYLATFTDEPTRQRQWRRVWNGYVAFRTTGTLGADVVADLTGPDRARRRVLAMIERKKQYGNLNHGRVAAATGMSDNLFDSPDQLLDALRDSGRLDEFLRQMKFGGRMHKVFSAEEQQLWQDWIDSLAESRTPAATDPFAPAAKPLGDRAPQAAPQGPVRHLVYASSTEEVRNHPRGTLLGHGSAH